MNKYWWYVIWVISFFIGRLTVSMYSATSTKSINLVEQKEVVNDSSSTNQKIIIREKSDSLGNTTKITTFDLHSNSDINTASHNKGRIQEDKEGINNRKKHGTVNVSALISNSGKGVSVTKELIGPITVGAFALSDGTFGASLGLNF